MRVLVIDDSVVSRRLIGDALLTDPEIEVITAASGKIGISKLAQQQLDLVTLDVEMPEMSGIDTLKIIRQHYPLLPVIMVSRLTEKGASETLDALFFGANDYVGKPSSEKGVEDSILTIRKQLLPKIKALTSKKVTSHAPSFFESPVQPKFNSLVSRSIKVLAIGSSTGGPNALIQVLSGLAGKLSIPIVIAQHTLPMFSKHIVERLSDRTGLKIQEGVEGMSINSQSIYMAPGDKHMLLNNQGKAIQLINEECGEDEARPSVDKLFSSVAEVYGAGVLAVVLTGMGRDGLLGCQKVREQGGEIYVQDEQSSVVWGMPGAVAKAGVADRVIALNQMAQHILDRVGS